MGVRSSCAMSEAKSVKRRNESSRRASMSLNAVAVSFNSIGMESSWIRASSRSIEASRLMRAISRNGMRPKRVATQPSTALSNAVKPMTHHSVALNARSNSIWCEMSVATATVTGDSAAHAMGITAVKLRYAWSSCSHTTISVDIRGIEPVARNSAGGNTALGVANTVCPCAPTTVIESP